MVLDWLNTKSRRPQRWPELGQRSGKGQDQDQGEILKNARVGWRQPDC